jgi:hypothetical protein
LNGYAYSKKRNKDCQNKQCEMSNHAVRFWLQAAVRVVGDLRLLWGAKQT